LRAVYLTKGKYVQRHGLDRLCLAVNHTADFLGGFSAKRCFATLTTNGGRDILYQDKSAINQKDLIDQLCMRFFRSTYVTLKHS